MASSVQTLAQQELAVQEQAQALAACGDVRGAARLMDRWLASHDGDWGAWLYLAGLYARLARRDEAVAAFRVSARQLEGVGLYERARATIARALELLPGHRELELELRRLAGLASRPAAAPAPAPSPRRAAAKPPVPSPPAPWMETTSLVPRAVVARGAPTEPPSEETCLLPRIDAAPQARVRGGSSAQTFQMLPRTPSGEVRARREAPVRVLSRAAAAGRARREPTGRAQRALPRVASREVPVRAAAGSPAPAPGRVTDPHLAIFDILDAEAALQSRRRRRR